MAATTTDPPVAIGARRLLSDAAVVPLVAGVTIAAGILRFATLGTQSYWEDEGYTVQAVDGGFGHLLHLVARTESNPPLYYALAWAWAHAFGTGEVALRSLSALFGTLLVPVAYLLARTVAGRGAALAAAVLVAVNPLLVWYSQEARNYALLALLGGLSLLACARVAERRGDTRRTLWAWGAVSALALATHYFAFFLIAAELVWLLLARPLRRRQIELAALPVLVVGIALLPLLQHQRHTAGQSFDFQSESLSGRAAKVVKQFLVGFNSPSERLVFAVAFVCAVAGIASYVRVPGWRRLAPLAALGIVSVAAPFALAVVGLDYVKTQNLLASLLPFAVVVAAGLVATRAGLAALALLGATSLLVVVSVATNPQYQRNDWRGAIRSIGSPIGPRAIVVTPEPGPVFDHYDAHAATLPPRGAVRVREIDLIGLAIKPSGGRFEPPAVPAGAPFRGFRQLAIVRSQKYAVVRYVSGRPRTVTAAELRAARLGDWAPDRATLFAQP
jgi:hypothetical protein